MMPQLRRFEQWLIDNEDVSLTVFLTLLCVLSFVILPFVEMVGVAAKLVSIAYTLLFVTGAFIGGLAGGWRIAAMGLAVFSITAAWLGPGDVASTWHVLGLSLSIAFMAFLCLVLTREVFRPGEVNGHRLRGCVAVYLLLGFIFGLTYALIERQAPGSFSGLEVAGIGLDAHSAIYFSFVTLTTLGFGDVTPISELACNLVVIEAIVGQLFLAIMIGRLVSLSTPQSPDSQPAG